MDYRPAALLLSCLFISASLSTWLLEALKEEHCADSFRGAIFLYFPLFLLNNVLVTLGVFGFWIIFEKEPKEKTGRYRTLSEPSMLDNPTVNEKSAISEKQTLDETNHGGQAVIMSVYDNVNPWDYEKPFVFRST